MSFFIQSLFVAIPIFFILIVIEMFVSMNMGIKVNRPADTISSILTSGGKQTAMKEKSKIKEIIQQFDSRFNIIAAGSITDKIFNNVHSHIRSKEYHGRKIVAELQ
jgi:copper homeostasis protein CutC